MKTPIDKSFFYTDRVDRNELTFIFLNELGRGLKDVNSTTFFKDEGSLQRLTIHYEKQDAIKAIEATQDFPPDELKALQKRVKITLVQNQEEQVGRLICFSLHRRVRHFYRGISFRFYLCRKTHLMPGNCTQSIRSS